MKFKIGDLITGKVDNGYSITDNKSLLLVIGNDSPSEMTVMVLYHNREKFQLRETYTVENHESNFEYITIDEYLTLYPDCYKIGNTELQGILERYQVIKTENTKSRSHLTARSGFL